MAKVKKIRETVQHLFPFYVMGYNDLKGFNSHNEAVEYVKPLQNSAMPVQIVTLADLHEIPDKKVKIEMILKGRKTRIIEIMQ